MGSYTLYNSEAWHIVSESEMEMLEKVDETTSVRTSVLVQGPVEVLHECPPRRSEGLR